MDLFFTSIRSAFRICVVWLLALGATATPPAQSSAGVARQQQDRVTRPTSEPYKGDLSIFEDPKRDEKLQPARIMSVLRIQAGSKVADLGAGSGWFTVRAARQVGANGMVYAVEINTEYIKHIEQRAAREGLTNIRTVLGKEDDPMLPAKEIDAALLLKTYHELAQPIRLMMHLKEALRPGARVGIIDKNGSGSDHGLDKKTVVEEVHRAGFRLIEEHDFVKPDGMDYFLVFEAKK
jgi:predicted methyltransferase